MSKTPSAVLDAITAGPRPVAGECVYPVTLAAYAILEAIESPLFSGGRTDPGRWVPTLFVMTRPIREVIPVYRAGQLEEAALVWAVDVPVASFRLLVDAATEALLSAFKAADGMGGKEDSPDFPSATDGSSKSPNGAAAPTDGAGNPSAMPSP